jgi:hypothetical protein
MHHATLIVASARNPTLASTDYIKIAAIQSAQYIKVTYNFQEF